MNTDTTTTKLAQLTKAVEAYRAAFNCDPTNDGVREGLKKACKELNNFEWALVLDAAQREADAFGIGELVEGFGEELKL